MSELILYNSLQKEKETFVPIDPSHVRLYACGPTVYNYAHIGNARMAVVFDVLVRVLKQLYPKVTYVSNITDIEDKIIDAAKAAGVPIEQITTKYADIYNQDMAHLNVNAPDIQPLATSHVDEMIALIETLIEAGAAYEKDGHVLFHVPAYEAYGRLSGRSRDEQVAGARVEIAPYKKDPADFVLWKPSSDEQPGWDSPWGYGRPGWHIECSAMAEKHLGLPFDIHGGGADLKFPHHENEIAQSCAAHHIVPEGFAKTWIHNGFVTVEGEKMSKSLGNVTLVHDLVESYPGEALRLTLLSAQYRQPLDWTEDAIHQSKKLLDKLYAILHEVGDEVIPVDIIPNQIMQALFDDLNTPRVFAELNALLKSDLSKAELAGQLKAIGAVLGILQENPAIWLGFEKEGDVDVTFIEDLLEQRKTARAEKNFARSDEIRDQLKDMGIVIEDTPDGAKWRWA